MPENDQVYQYQWINFGGLFPYFIKRKTIVAANE
jgi:hypothetical protein